MPDPIASEADFPQPQIPPQAPADEQRKESDEHLADWGELRSRAIYEASRWKLSRQPRSLRAFERASQRTAEIIAAALAIARKSSTRDNKSSEVERLLEIQRPLASALEQMRSAVKACRDLAQLEPEDNSTESVPRVYRAATAFLRSINYDFDEQSFSVFFGAMQECGPFTMNELWILRSMLLLVLLERIAGKLPPGLSARAPDSLSTPALGSSDVPTEVLTGSLRRIVEAKGAEPVEEMSVTERVLAEDPADVYRKMDSESRNRYRSVVNELARHSNRSEVEIARAAVALSQLAKAEWNSEPRRAERHSHVGYHLVGGGRAVLEHQIGYRPPLTDQIRDAIRRKPDAFYLVGIELLTFAIVAFVLNGLRAQVPLIWALILLLIPATESAIGAMNQLAAALMPPRPLPKLDFSKGIPDGFTTMVAVPTLLTSESQVQQTVRDLELRYLGNRDPHLHFALLTDFPDSPQPPRERGTLVDLCSRLIEELNEKYRAHGAGLFFLFHRDPVYNPVESTWMGWERKRGKLMDFNNLLRGKFDSFPVKVGDLSLLPTVRYVITLDADTQLPRDSARRLVGALAHPLNRAVIDPATNTVVEGYGILQPRIGISVRSANRSRLASIYSGQAGFDNYTRAVSDVYQDLMEEGSFTGKGIYEVDVFQRVLSDRFPLNTILSHDLIEGAYARAGLVSDIELIDDYPSHFSAFSRRKHRWVRGDWQIMRWLLPRVPDHSGRFVKNPISVISKWKILDNLRRSLVEPATFVLLLAGWFFLPGGPAHWTLAVLALLLIPAYLRLILALLNLPRAPYLPGYLSDIADAFVTDQVNVFMLLAFLAHQVLVTLDAIVRTVVRLTITRRRLLEWETAAEAEAGAGRRTPVDLYLELTPVVSIVIGLLLLAIRASALPMAAPILVIWALSGLLSRWLNRPLRPGRSEITPQDEEFLRTAALRTWRFFQSFSTSENNWLIPDTVQQDPAIVIEHISPTNLGLLLNARIAAYELGYLSLEEFLNATEQTLSTMRRMARFRGHFFNWYNTLTLEPLPPQFVSTVDSGNLAGCLWVLKQKCLQLVDHESPQSDLQGGLRDYVRVVLQLTPPDAASEVAIERLRTAADRLSAPPDRNHLAEIEVGLAELDSGAGGGTEELRYWVREAQARVSELREQKHDQPSCFCDRLQRVAAECDELVAKMDFLFLYRPERKVLSIGYNFSERRLEDSCYDLLASEARTAAFVAIAKGDLPQESWFRMGRALTFCYGDQTLLSWSGTMFEYLMPAVWMKTYPRTLLDQTLRSAVDCQRKAQRQKSIPWGISESACSQKNDLGHYVYHAFGLRDLALRPDLFSGTVISPYSSCLALGVNTTAAVANLRHMHQLGWLGDHGFHEAADYTPSSEVQPERFELVRSWMAHHQGMIFLSVCNLLAGSAIQNLFHAEPMVAATERLLQERIPRGVPIERTAA
jgi:hypothetical protein